jgi:hypothetical protein
MRKADMRIPTKTHSLLADAAVGTALGTVFDADSEVNTSFKGTRSSWAAIWQHLRGGQEMTNGLQSLLTLCTILGPSGIILTVVGVDKKR